MPTKNLKHSLWDSDYYRLSGLRPKDEQSIEQSPKSTFKFSTILIAEAVLLWIFGLGFFTYMVMKTAF